MNKQLTNEEQILVLKTRIEERSLIVYVIESALADEDFKKDYRLALKDEISNHKIAIKEYNEELKKLINVNLTEKDYKILHVIESYGGYISPTNIGKTLGKCYAQASGYCNISLKRLLAANKITRSKSGKYKLK